MFNRNTAICSYGNVTLKASVVYNQYTWSTGEVSPAITITQPGLYWLQVKDKNNCIGKDSILVNPKQCLAGFFIPTAFTPNNDNRNDIFRPLIFGNIRQYKFVIFNKWGQIIYQSSVPLEGWNGTIKGAEQDTNVFTWICTYQLEGQAVKVEKGIVTLLR